MPTAVKPGPPSRTAAAAAICCCVRAEECVTRISCHDNPVPTGALTVDTKRLAFILKL